MTEVPSESDAGLFEAEPDGLQAGIVVKNLRKVFVNLTRANVVAVDNVTFKAFKGGVTTLLGHNGAGKTTTMNVLTGNTNWILLPSFIRRCNII
jgi:ABC-type glutathione transport system ATPase component